MRLLFLLDQTRGAKGTSLVQDVSQVLKNVEVEGFDSRVNVRTDGSIKENVPCFCFSFVLSLVFVVFQRC
jgi:hypothetical protein